ncbi:hypothetical protein ACJIZ3_016663 [Penstemon smallii]|uniref:NB-ARC domain-containing protein n=1 Tax=Penstemon smallii TaxID=265156 RepID=A0ABD3SU24_9LAMI
MAYAVLASLFTTTDQMLNPDPYSIPCKRETIESLHNNVSLLLSFLENTPPHSYQTIKSLEAKIRDVAYKAEDILESHIASYVLSISGSENDANEEKDETDENMLSEEALEEVMKGFESLMEDVKEIQGTGNFGGLLKQMTSISVGSSRPASTGKSKFVLLDEDFMMPIKEQLASEESRLKVLPIVGMGGIGKTTLAKAVLEDPLCVGHFDVRAWVTISQEYRIQDVVQNLLKDIEVRNTKTDIGVDLDGNVGLHKILFNRRYLIVLDDVWENKACDELQKLFPDNNNGSRIMVTTRQSGVATYAAKSYHEMKLLNDDMSWDLLCQELFEEGNCPSELVEIGKEIAKKCNGLPLTISVIGGLLSKQKMTREHWEHVADNIKSVLTEKDDQCLKMLSLSYNYLPHHLKPCFLYMAAFPEDHEINVTALLLLWVAEGFLKPTSSRNMEEVAEENLNDLIERNLILIDKRNYKGNLVSCRIHDLLRDLSITEARKEKFLYVWDSRNPFNPEEANGHRRLSILPSGVEEDSSNNGIEDEFKVMPGNRSFISFLDSHDHLILGFGSKLWDVPLNIWNMPRLRRLQGPCVKDNIHLVPAARTEMPVCVLKILEKLSILQNFRFDDEVHVRIPNLRSLNICYDDDNKALDWSYYGLKNIVNLSKLETLTCFFNSISTETLIQNLAFPISLKELILSGCKISWEHMKIVGVLPNLEVLKLYNQAFVGPTWGTIEDHFKKLEYLIIEDPGGLEEWVVEDANHFPSLRHLDISYCMDLEEIPSCIGDIPTLEKIDLYECSDGIVSSAQNIQDDNIDIRLTIYGDDDVVVVVPTVPYFSHVMG